MVQESDRVGDVHKAIVVGVRGVFTRRFRLSEEELTQDCNRVGDIEISVPGRIPANERLKHGLLGSDFPDAVFSVVFEALLEELFPFFSAMSLGKAFRQAVLFQFCRLFLATDVTGRQGLAVTVAGAVLPDLLSVSLAFVHRAPPRHALLDSALSKLLAMLFTRQRLFASPEATLENLICQLPTFLLRQTGEGTTGEDNLRA
jgi:hypothetical protein